MHDIAVRRAAACALVVVTAFCASAHGREKVRDTRFDWRVLSTAHFDIHYCGDDVLPRAREAGAWLERAHDRLRGALAVAPTRRVPVFLYRSHNEFEQTNLFPGTLEGIGAFAESARDRIVIPLYPSERYFQTVLEHELVHVFQFASLYPTRIPSYLFLAGWLHPSWLIEGMADHLAPGRGTDVAMRLRDGALDGTLRSIFELRGFAHLNPHEIRGAYEEGAAFIAYLDRVSGGGTAMRLLRMFSAHIPWSVDTVFALATGVQLRRADLEFRATARDEAQAAVALKADPGAMPLTDDRAHYRVANSSPAWSPDGARVAFLSDREDLATIHVVNADGSNRRRLLGGALNSTIEFVRSGDGALDWSRDGARLCFVGEWVNRDYLYVLDVDGGALRRIPLELDEIASPAFSPDGRQIALSGVRAGVSDIYTVDLETLAATRLTDTRAHDDWPRFSPDGREIVYASERGGQSDLYVVGAAGGAERRLTDTPALERQPDWSPDGTRVVCSSDAGGTSNLRVVDVATGAATALTDVIGGAFSPRWSPDGTRLVFGYYRHGNANLYVLDGPVAAARDPAAGEGSRAAELAPFFTGSVAGEPHAFRDDFALETLTPLIVINPFSAGDLRGDHQITGTVAPFFSEMGSRLTAQVSVLDLSHRADLDVTGFDLVEASETIEDREYGVQASARLPFDQYRRMDAGFIAYTRDRTTIAGAASSAFYSGAFLALSHDNRIGRGTDVTGGCLYRVALKMYDEALGSDRTFSSVGFTHARYLQARRDQILALRLAADFSDGPQPEAFDLSELVRGVEPNAHEEAGRFAATLEYRFPIVRDINANVLGSWVFLKDLRGYVFADAGYVTAGPWAQPLDDAADPAWHASWGLGLRVDLFLLQQLPLRLFVEAQCVDDAWQSGAGLALDVAF